jgi:cellulose synthase/poly-beta-1,6-N-acetylglucosamine synthase-like glycosyltransferase
MPVVAHLLALLAFALAALLVPAVLVFACQVLLFACRGRPFDDPPIPAAGTRDPVVVLMPAHDEAEGIGSTLAQLMPRLSPGDRVLVVADNCSDATAAIAREAGAEVVERTHVDRGKGFALAFGIDFLEAHPPGAVVILDADCVLGPGALDALLFELARTARPVQALYLMTAPPDASLGRRLAEFAWRVRNWVRPAGWRRVGMPCQLMGTGMAFSWEMLARAQLANASLVEDMKLGIDLAVAGMAPVFCDRAVVTSTFPESSAASRTQRTRWEHGHLEMILRQTPPLLRAALSQRDARLLGMALDLAVPPLALLAGLLFLDALLASGGRLLGAGDGAPVLAATLLIAFCAAVLLAWLARGRDLVRLTELLAVPWYVMAKVPIYLRFIRRRQTDWVRTDRK